MIQNMYSKKQVLDSFWDKYIDVNSYTTNELIYKLELCKTTPSKITQTFYWTNSPQGGDFWNNYEMGYNQEEGRKELDKMIQSLTYVPKLEDVI